MKHSTVADNTSNQGGGIANYGDATILDSKIDHNGQYMGGNIFNAGTLVVKALGDHARWRAVRAGSLEPGRSNCDA